MTCSGGAPSKRLSITSGPMTATSLAPASSASVQGRPAMISVSSIANIEKVRPRMRTPEEDWFPALMVVCALTAIPVRQQSVRSEEHTSELQSLAYLVCRLLLEKKKK